MDQFDIEIESLQGGKFLKRATKLFETLADVGTERDTAGKRKLLFSHYAGLVLLGFFNPVMQSLRGMQRASEVKRIQKLIGGKRTSLGSLSESVTVFEPELLEPIVTGLLEQIAQNGTGPGPFRNIPESIPNELARKLVSVDGSVLKVLPQIVSTAAKKSGDGQWRLHLQFRALSGLPGDLTITRNDAGGETDERSVLADHLASESVYVCDRGYERYALYQAIVDAGSDYVIRAKDRPVDILEERPLTAAAREARVVSDELISASPSGNRRGVITHPVRRIVIQKRDQGRVRKDRQASGTVILWTSLMDVPAEVIAAIYELRWTIELFFRFLKHVLGCRRLLTNKASGVAIQVYCALIACLLQAELTGGPMGKVAVELLLLYLSGWSTEEELLAGLSRHRAAQELARSRAASRR
jgi:hypothetical protein